MKKVVCPSCGLVNLEKFVTFPYCAACGAHLPEKQPSKFRFLLSRPVKPLYWALWVGSGIAVLAFGAIRVAVETRDRTEKSLLIYAQIPRQIAADGLIDTSFTLDTTEETSNQTFSEIRMRISRDTLRNFELVEIKPPPTSSENFGSGQYYNWENLDRTKPVHIVLAPKNLGELSFRFMVYARDYESVQARNTITVSKNDLARSLALRAAQSKK